ncbi:hypothetical protein [Ruania rhizosphaerae]|uniref:hypothetical protein n=1 Tax=Ruania rhizosphaerae TaxID=1840413 RepID=UPI0013595B5A|nr:hypothetical protein [Ruania rhizosphaerae]
MLFVLVQVSPAPEPAMQEVELEDLDDTAMKLLRKERNLAIDYLAKRKMLPTENIAALKARLIGRLHIDEHR